MDYDERRRSSDKYSSSSRPSSRSGGATDDRDYRDSHHHHHHHHHSEHDDRYVGGKHNIKRSRSPRSRSRSPTPHQQHNTPSSGYNRNSGGGQSYNKNYGGGGGGGHYRQYRDGPGSAAAGPQNTMPSRTIMLRNIPFSMGEIELKHELSSQSVAYKDVRLVKSRETGMNRGFAFIEFASLDDSQRWMNQTQGWIQFGDSDNRVQLCYSHSEDSQRNETSNAAEWDCSKCGVRNFKKRDRCFKCGITKEESEIRKGGDGYDQVGSTPCNTIILRGLDALTNKEAIVEAVNAKTNHFVVAKNCEVSRDPFTSVSNGFAFVELNSIADAGYMLQLLAPAFEIDGKLVSVNYSKNSFKTAISQTEMKSVNYYSAAMESTRDRRNDQVVISSSANQTDRTNSAAALAQAAMKSMAKKQVVANHYANTYKNGDPTSSSVEAGVGAAAAAAGTTNTTGGYSTPDVSKFVYDEKSGYYYDFSTGFYYDATSHYYYNPTSQQYMYWDPTTSNYIPVASGSTTTSADQSAKAEAVTPSTIASSESDSKQVSLEKSKVVTKTPAKTAAQIAKDMEKWADSMNKKKEATKKVPVTIPSTTPSRSSESTKTDLSSSSSSFSPAVSSFSSSFSSFGEAKSAVTAAAQAESSHTINSSHSSLTSQSSLPAQKRQSQVEMSEKGTEAAAVLDESSYIDTSKLACLLCKRKFDSLDILNKHVAKSDLHKNNLEKLRRRNESDDNSNSNSSSIHSESINHDTLSAALKFQQRAEKELKVKMRDERSLSPPPLPARSSKSAAKVSKTAIPDDHQDEEDQSTSQGSSDFATKMMKKFGWTEGSGIGKNLQGISAPIKATMHQKGSGLGASPANYEADPNESYHQAVKRSARSRLEQMMNR